MFRNPAAEFVYYRTYSRWNDALGRRETWEETVDRAVAFLKAQRGDRVPAKVFRKIREKMLSFDVMPSMRLVWAAGSAAEFDHVTTYNCAFAAVDDPIVFSEALYILMCGTGFGFSVEAKHVAKLPVVPVQAVDATVERHVVADSKAGWADSVKHLVQALYSGKSVEFDYSQVRPRGSRLKTMGGRASGPEPLILLHNFIKELFNGAQGRKLLPLEVHDIMNQIAEIVVVGGVRRSSQISLSDLTDESMRHAKEWPYPLRRAMSNNSAVYLERPPAVEFLKEWAALAASGTGERGIFNLGAIRASAPERRDASRIEGTNPCAEIALRSKEFCNLSSVVIRPDDDLISLLEKVETATWVGAIQSTLTNFPYLRPEWKQNCEDERLLGVSLSGQMDNPKVLTPDALKAMRSKALRVARSAARQLGVNMSASVTCVKPEGTSSQVTVSGSGLHVWYSPYFIRRYRISSMDPLFRMLKDQGVEMSPENGQTAENASTWVVSFPMKAPKGAVTRHDVNAIDQLEHYKKVQENWCEHNASATIYVQESEWFEVGNWVYQNWGSVCGLSFLPSDNGKYQQAPLEEITKERYEELVKKFPKIDYSQLSRYELEDQTTGAQTLACVSGVCEL